MIQKNLGFAEILITDSSFGHITVHQKDFKERLEHSSYQSYPTVWMYQEHMNCVQFCGSSQGKDRVYNATDGLGTTHNNIMLVTKTADCIPILLWNEKSHTIGVLHCGWKGFLAGIINSFFIIKFDDHKTNCKDFKVYLGPHIRTESFEVQEDFISQLPQDKKYLVDERAGKTYFNLTKGVIDELNAFQVTDIEDCGIDTYSDSEFFSYRKWSQTPEDQRAPQYSTFASTIVMR